MIRIKYILLLIVILSLSKDRQCYAQNYADKEYYLVDSLDLDALTETDLQIVDSCLKVYHKAKYDTSKINAINVIVEESWDENVYPKYNDWVHLFVLQKLKAKHPAPIIQHYKIALAVALIPTLHKIIKK